MYMLGELLPKPTCLLHSVRSFRVQSAQLCSGLQTVTLSCRAQGWNGRCYAAVAAPEAPSAKKKGKAKGDAAAAAGFESIIGIECHIQLNTKTKAFCSCRNASSSEPNTNICPVCLAHPGTLPVLNLEAVRKAVAAALALKCQLHHHSKFDRKQYFYPDLPKGYQISQYDEPLATEGSLKLLMPDGAQREVRIERAHMEEDAGKSSHAAGGASTVDYNRAGVPLLEVVTGPDLRSGREAAAYAAELRRIMVLLGVLDNDMQDSAMRCDVNVSVRPKGEQRLRTRVEIKNMNSLTSMQKAIEFEVNRQVQLVQEGREAEVVQETRLFDEAKQVTFTMRKKEGLADYRYFPEPDLPPLVLQPGFVDSVQEDMPEMPSAARQRYLDAGLGAKETLAMTDDMATAAYYDAAVAAGAPAKTAANWVLGDLTAHCKETKASMASLQLSPQTLADLIALIDDGTISGKIGKQLLPDLLQGKVQGSLKQHVGAQGLAQISDPKQIGAWISEVLEAFPKELEQYRGGKTKLQGHFSGQVMKRSQGKVNPSAMNKILTERLNASS